MVWIDFNGLVCPVGLFSIGIKENEPDRLWFNSPGVTSDIKHDHIKKITAPLLADYIGSLTSGVHNLKDILNTLIEKVESENEK